MLLTGHFLPPQSGIWIEPDCPRIELPEPSESVEAPSRRQQVQQIGVVWSCWRSSASPGMNTIQVLWKETPCLTLSSETPYWDVMPALVLNCILYPGTDLSCWLMQSLAAPRFGPLTLEKRYDHRVLLKLVKRFAKGGYRASKFRYSRCQDCNAILEGRWLNGRLAEFFDQSRGRSSPSPHQLFFTSSTQSRMIQLILKSEMTSMHSLGRASASNLPKHPSAGPAEMA